MKIKKLFLLSFLVVATLIAKAQEVDFDLVTRVAKNCFYQQKTLFDKSIDYNTIKVNKVELFSNDAGTPCIYAVNMQGGGFVLVSAQDYMFPIIGFNTDDGVEFDLEARGPQYAYYFQGFLDEIEYIKTSKIVQQPTVAAQWEIMLTTDYNTLVTDIRDKNQVGPLLPSLWNQDNPYNYYAPETTVTGAPGGKCYAGCVATAMSTIMHYWNWPRQGQGQYSYYATPCNVTLTANFGETTYDYESMPTELSNTSHESSIHASALLQHHAGVAVSMGYCLDGCTSSSSGDGSSGAYSTSVAPALKQYFKFTAAKYKAKNTQPANWEQSLMDQFDNAMPVYYSGSGAEGGHAWNCDGYRTTNGQNFFHHNFNWGSWLNDWYTESGLAAPGFPSDHRIVYDIYPPSNQYPIYAEGNIVLTEKFGRISDGSGPVLDYQANSQVSWLIAPQSEYDSIKDIKLEWEQFELGNNDEVKVYDGEDANAPLVGTYSGTTIPPSFTSTGNKLFITFESVGKAPGFVFTYNAKPHKYCFGTKTITDSIGRIESNPADKYYTRNNMCRWIVKPKDITHGLTISIDYIDTFDENDYLEIFDIATQEVLTFWGNEAPEDVLEFSTEGVIITFKTDNMNTVGHGFALDFSPILNVEDYYIGEIIAYPNPAKDILTIKFDNKVNDNINIEMYNVTGAKIFDEPFNNKGLYHKDINVSSLPTGMYIVRITSAKGVSTKKVVIE